MGRVIQDAISDVIKRHPYWSSAIRELEPLETTRVSTAATDGQYLMYNKEWMEGLPPEQRAGVVLHEVMHCTFLHLWRIEDRDRLAFNVAADYAINIMVNETLEIPEDSCLSMKYYGMSAEQIYDTFKEKEDENGNKYFEDEDGNKIQSQDWGEHEYWPGGSKHKDIKKILDEAAGKSSKNKKGEDEKESTWNRVFRDTVSSDYGDMPGALQRTIRNFFYVPVMDWSEIVYQLLTHDINDYSFMRPDKRFMDSDFLLPGVYSEDALTDVIFAYDTSASVSQEQLRAYITETEALFDNFPNLDGWIAICDAQLYTFEQINRGFDFDDVNFTGGGGTSFVPVFERIAQENLSPKAVFYFTDTYGQFPPETDYPVFWLVSSYVGDTQHYDVPFGQLIKFLDRNMQRNHNVYGY